MIATKTDAYHQVGDVTSYIQGIPQEATQLLKATCIYITIEIHTISTINKGRQIGPVRVQAFRQISYFHLLANKYP